MVRERLSYPEPGPDFSFRRDGTRRQEPEYLASHLLVIPVTGDVI